MPRKKSTSTKSTSSAKSTTSKKTTPTTKTTKKTTSPQGCTHKQNVFQVVVIALLCVLVALGVVGLSTNSSDGNIKSQVKEAVEEIEAMKVGGQENFEMLKKIMSNEQQQQQYKQQFEMMLSQLGDTPDTAEETDTTGNDQEENNTEENTQDKTSNVPQTDRPVAELFIMSYCPYGLQAQKGYVEVMEKMSDVADVKINFVHYLMHGEKEGIENTRQYCIQEKQTDKYVPYLKCFLKAGDTEGCLNEANVNTTSLENCMNTMEEEYDMEGAIAEAKETGQRYPTYPLTAKASQDAGVQGSPTLVINGQKVEKVGRNAESYKQAICNAFNTKPDICNESFSTKTYGPMFGFEDGGNASADASCE